MDCEVLKKIAVISENEYESIELNYVQWGKNPPKYDLRKWKDGKPLKGVTLSEEELSRLLSVLIKELWWDTIHSLRNNISDDEDDVETDSDESELDESDEYDEPEYNSFVQDDIHVIDYRTFFIRKNMSDCDQNDHDYIDVIASETEGTVYL